jgi:hypothetical protein
MPMLMSRGSDGAQFTLKQGVTRIGRNPSTDWQISDPSISGIHCEVIVDGDNVRIRDLDSTNGTFVDEMRIREAFLHEGQSLRLGSCPFCFVCDAPRPQSAIRLSERPAPPPPPRPPAPPPNVPLPPVAPGVMTCANHPSHAAAFVCKKCGGYFCGACVNEQTVVSRKLRFCRACGDECIALREPAQKRKRPETFFELLPKAFLYPFKRDGIILLVTGTIFFGLLDAMLHGTSFGGYFVSGYVVLVQLFAIGYLFAYMKSVAVASAYGEDEMPKYPDFSNFYDDIMHPIILVFATVLLCFLPLGVYMYYIDYTLPGWETVGFYALLGLGCCALPVSLLSVFLHETVFALNPLLLIISVVRVPMEYTVVCIVLAILVGLRLLMMWLVMKTKIIPVLPEAADEFVSLYLLCVEMRIIGLLFHTRRKDLGWSMS